jgi:ribosome-associated protein
LDLRAENAWTDFFVIATATSGAHLLGLERHVREWCGENGVTILRVSPRGKGGPAETEEEWLIIDLGTIVVHLMTAKIRAFYELERLWDTAAVIFQENPAAASPGITVPEDTPYSSSSSSAKSSPVPSSS